MTDSGNGYNCDTIANSLTVAKGLSKLQRQILSLALRNHRVPANNGRTHTRHAEILVECFGWDADLKSWCRTRSLYGQSFSRKNRPNYNAANASVSRCCQRLADRGLVECFSGAYARFAAIELTELGLSVAEAICK